jgi:universal stress protein A
VKGLVVKGFVVRELVIKDFFMRNVVDKDLVGNGLSVNAARKGSTKFFPCRNSRNHCMSNYKKILIALDFHGDNAKVIERGAAMASANNAEIFLIHVNEPLVIAYAADGMSWSDQVVQLETSIRQEAQKKMAETSARLQVPTSNCLTREGKPAHEIHAAAKEQSIDLIVMGTHGQSGLKLLLGSTANSVLHGATCDVLAVRIGE